MKLIRSLKKKIMKQDQKNIFLGYGPVVLTEKIYNFFLFLIISMLRKLKAQVSK